jgi:hypothetical protein
VFSWIFEGEQPGVASAQVELVQSPKDPANQYVTGSTVPKDSPSRRFYSGNGDFRRVNFGIHGYKTIGEVKEIAFSKFPFFLLLTLTTFLIANSPFSR